MTDDGKKPKYFWSDDLAAPSFGGLVGAFSVISLADYIATLRMMEMGAVREGNAVADLMMQTFGSVGMLLYKLLLMAVVLGIAYYLAPRRESTARGILWAGILITGIVLFRHLAIILNVAVWWG